MLSLLLISLAMPSAGRELLSPGGEWTPAAVAVMKADGTLTLAGGVTVPAGGWLEIRSPSPRPAFPQGAHAVLANGDRIAGTFLRGDDQAAVLKTESGEIRIPVASLDLLTLNEEGSDRWLPLDRKADYVRLANGETLAGSFEKFTADGDLVLGVDGKSRTVGKAVIKAIAFNPSLAVRKPPAGTHYTIVFANGDRITAKSLTFADGKAEMVTGFNAKLTVLADAVISVNRWSEEVISLTTLKPSKNETVPFGRVAWPMILNRSAKNAPLMLKTSRGLECFERGLGTHPQTVIEYPLAGKFRVFESTLGFDAESAKRGAAVVKVIVDGVEKPIGLPSLFTAADGVKNVRVDVTNSKTLKLVIDFAPGGDTQADLNWIEPRLLK